MGHCARATEKLKPVSANESHLPVPGRWLSFIQRRKLWSQRILKKMVDAALMEGIIEAKCMECGVLIQM
jgi:hypothetical protein